MDNEEFLPKINVDDIFDRKMEIGSLIQYNLLQIIIEEFIKRQKNMNDKISFLEKKYESFSFNQSIMGINTNDKSEGKIDELNSTKEINFKEDIINKDKDKVNENEKALNEEDNNLKINNEVKMEYENEEDKKIFNLNNKKEEIKIRELSYRIDRLESINKEIVKRLTFNLNESKNNIQNLSDKIDDKLNTEKNKIDKLYKNMKILESKIGENTILSNILKLNENNSNEDLIKVIQDFDEKMSKKMDSLEEHNKDNEEQIIKYKTEIDNLRNVNQVNIQSINNIRNSVNAFMNDFNESKIKNKNELNDINKLITEKENKLRNEIVDYSNENNKKISDLVIKLNNLAEKNNKNVDTKTLSSLNNEKIENLSNELKHYFSKGLADTENYLKSIINNLGIEKIESDIIKINNELKSKLIKKDLSTINFKLDEIDTKIYEIKNMEEEFKNKIESINNESSKNKKSIENLSGQLIKLYQPDLDYSSLSKSDLEQFKYYVRKDLFQEEVTKIMKKINKLLEATNENNKYIKLIDEKYKNSVDDKDLNNMYNYYLNALEEYKIISDKKYLDKKDGEKIFKYFEFQIKNINENIILNSPLSSGDNWLLAKKPLNSYLCASCESYIGELKSKKESLNYKRISPNENKKYRMGQGFSRMLQMVNMDLMKNAEKINDDLSIKNEENKITKNNLDHKLIPKINSSNNIRKEKLKNNSINKFIKNKVFNEIGLNNSNNNTVLNSAKKYNLNNEVIKNNNSIEIFNNNKEFVNIKNLDKSKSPKETFDNIQTYSKLLK